MTIAREFCSVLSRSIRTLPAQLILSVGAVAIAQFVYHVREDHLAVVAAVPCIAIFVVSRALILVPAPSEEKLALAKLTYERMPLLAKLFVYAIATEIIVLPTILVASGMYDLAGLQGAGKEAMKFLVVAAVAVPLLALAIFIVKTGKTIFGSIDVGKVFVAAASAVAELCYVPARIANLFGSHWRHS